MAYLITESEILSASTERAGYEGRLTFLRDNGEVIDAGVALGAAATDADMASNVGTGGAFDSALKGTYSPQDRVAVVVKSPDVRQYAGTSDTVQRLEVPGHLSGPDRFQSTHPSVKFFPNGWNGWRYWMAHTPYPFGNASHEDPCIAVSQDGKTWTVPSGFTNPLDDAPSGTQYNADTELAVSPDGLTLYCMWRFTDTTLGTVQFKVRSTTDGVTWTPAVVAMTHADLNAANYVSPTLAHDGTQWVMWAVNTVGNPNKLVRLTAPEITGPWSAATNCTADAGLNRDFWHVSVIRTADGWLALMNDTIGTVAGDDGDLYLMTSTDGLTWTRGFPLLARPFGTEYVDLYRGTLVPTDTGFDMWFGAVNADNRWGIYRAQLKIDPALRADSVKWIPAWDFRPPVAGATEGVVASTVNGWLLDATAPESVATQVLLTGWKRFSAEVWFAPTTTGAGDVKLDMNYYQFVPGTAITGPPAVVGTPTTMPGVTGQVVTKTIITSTTTSDTGPMYLRILRDAGNAADTYAADVLILGVKLTRLA